ncbi:hypothetical protein [Glycomyces sp. YM15]|uniref:hypothetical protein n=1 Tax=Glycomyces sp. YM15 TaxID=2800446 RepID=UPI0019635834|nr:hypothetical protein [Glycomyces sp. YM15]
MNVEPIRQRWAKDETRAGKDVRRILAVLDRTRALLVDAEAGLAKARGEHGQTCLEIVYWDDGDYEGECELAKFHAGPHFDGLYWFDDYREKVPVPANTQVVP